MTPEERIESRKRVAEAARASIQARQQAEDDIIIAKFDGALRGTQNIVEMLLETKRAAELSLKNSEIAIQILLVQNGQDMVDWDNLKEPTPPMPSNDQTGKVCHSCTQGLYKETSQQDNQFGILHCNVCRHQVNRWV